MAGDRARKANRIVRNRLIFATSALAVIVSLWALASFVAPRLGADTTEEVEFGSAGVYTVQGDASLLPTATGLTAEVWALFVRVTTREYAGAVMAEYRVSDKPESDTLAYVHQSDRPGYWTLAANLATSGDRNQLIATLIHEYGHILSLNAAELAPDASSCDTVDLAEGCALTTSAIWAFEQQFWSQYGPDAPAPDNEDEDIAWDFFSAHEDDFVSDYAATNVVEDFAESFMTWVMEDKVTGESVTAAKLSFFDDYPEFVAIRDRIRAEFADDLGLAN